LNTCRLWPKAELAKCTTRQCDRISESVNWDVLVRDWSDGRIKLALIRHLLRLRHRFADVLSVGSYEPLHVKGRHANNVISITRAFGRQKLIIAVGRHFSPLMNYGQIWPVEWQAGVEYPEKVAFEDLIHTNPIPGSDEISLAPLFRILPVSVVYVH